MGTAHLRFALTGETMFPPCTPYFVKACPPYFVKPWGTSRFPTLLHAHQPETG
jgi:hypothetical protein